VLWLLADNVWAQDNLQRQALACGVDDSRLVFAPRALPEDYLATVRDTFGMIAGEDLPDLRGKVAFVGLAEYSQPVHPAQCAGAAGAQRGAHGLVSRVGVRGLRGNRWRALHRPGRTHEARGVGPLPEPLLRNPVSPGRKLGRLGIGCDRRCHAGGLGGTPTQRRRPAPRLQRGAGRVQAQRIPYAVDPAVAMLERFGELVLVGSKPPVAFFAYPDKPGLLLPAACAVTTLAAVDEDIVGALQQLAERLGALHVAPAGVARLDRPALPSGRLTSEGIGAVLAAWLPEQAIVVDESVSTGRGFGPLTAGAPPHDWLNLMGGSIGFGPPAATGAAIAAPDRPVILLQADGSAMYTLQALWTMAREGLNVKTLVFANRAYQILRGEYAQVGAGAPGGKASDMLSLDRPTLDWVSLARGLGVEAGRVEDLDALAAALRRAMSTPGPVLIELVM